MAARKLECNPNPGARETFVADNPIAQPPNPSANVMSMDDAILKAGGTVGGKDSRARLMTYAELSALAPGLGANGVVDPRRRVWAVTVHRDVMTPGSLRWKPAVVHVFTVVYDAESGQATDLGYGLDVVK